MAYLYKVKSIEDFEDYYLIKSDPTAILWSGFSTAPDKEKLKDHFMYLIGNHDDNLENRGGDKILVYLKDEETNKVMGYDLMTRIDDETIESSGHSILSNYQGKGFGTVLYKLLVNLARDLGYKKFTVWISENNIGSIKNVERNGFVRTNEFRKVKLAAFDREDIFYKYECIL